MPNIVMSIQTSTGIINFALSLYVFDFLIILIVNKK